MDVTGQLPEATRAYELRNEIYPRSVAGWINLGLAYEQAGQYEKALERFQQARRLAPDDMLAGGNTARMLVCLDRPAEALAIGEMLLPDSESPYFRRWLYQAAFLQNDESSMSEQARAGESPGMFNEQAAVAAYFGRIEEARDFSRRATELSQRSGFGNESTAETAILRAYLEAMVGYREEAAHLALAELASSRGKFVLANAAWISSRCRTSQPRNGARSTFFRLCRW